MSYRPNCAEKDKLIREQRDEIVRLRILVSPAAEQAMRDLAIRAERAEAERDAAIKRAEIAEGEVDLYAEQVDELMLPIPFGAEHGRAWYEAVQESINAAMKVIEAAKAMRDAGVTVGQQVVQPDGMADDHALNEFIGLFDGPLQRAFDAALAAFEKEQGR